MYSLGSPYQGKWEHTTYIFKKKYENPSLIIPNVLINAVMGNCVGTQDQISKQDIGIQAIKVSLYFAYLHTDFLHVLIQKDSLSGNKHINPH